MRKIQSLTTLVAAVLLSSGADGCPPYVELATTTTYSYQSLHQQGVDVTPSATSFKFQVRASNDAHVALLQDDGVTNRNIYEIVIGGWRNTQSVIRTGMKHTNRVTARHRPLSASRFRDFWISWESGVISVGTGTAVGAGGFMSWRDPSPHPVRYIAVSTGWRATGVWRFTPPLDVSLTTNTVYQYQSLHRLGVNLAPKATSFTFKVRAPHNVHVALLQEDGLTYWNTYEIVIGGWRNSQSVIRTGRQHDNRVTARHRPLNATEFRDFWISWEDGVISVGNGTAVGVGRFMSWRDPSPHPVRYIAVSTGCGATGLWKFERNLPLVCLETGDDYHYHSLDDLGFHLSGETAFTFWVESTSEAYIALLSNRDNYHSMFEIVIGGRGNTQSVIRDRSQGPSRGGARFGRKHLPSRRRSQRPSRGGALFGRKHLPSRRRSQRPSRGGGLFGRKHLPSRRRSQGPSRGGARFGRKHLPFRTRSQGPSRGGALFGRKHLPSQRRSQGPSREGARFGRKRLPSRRRSQGPSRGGPLSGSKHLPFWISVSGGTIAVGAGRVVGRRTFLSCTNRSLTQIRHVSVATGRRSKGKWLF